MTTPPVATYQNPIFGGLADPMGLRDLGDFYSYGTGDLYLSTGHEASGAWRRTVS